MCAREWIAVLLPRCRASLAATQLVILAAGNLTSLASPAAELIVTVMDHEGRAVSEAAVYALPLDPDPAPAVGRERPVMSQLDEQFVPHVLVVQTGTAVDFPNNDAVSHHVYSFSAPKPFELPLYKGTAYPPVTFEAPGIIDLGCNIHDHMEAHILVVDTPYFDTTGTSGRAEIAGLPAGDYSVRVYTPRSDTRNLPEPRAVTLSESGPTELAIQFERRLRPPHSATNESLNWSRY